MKKPVIGVMGPGSGATQRDIENAFDLGKLIAEKEWVLLTGGRSEGVMDAASKGAKSGGGLTIGIIPTADNTTTSEAVDIAIITSMGSARNNINVLSSDVVIACGMGTGTASEVALALKAAKHVILLTDNQGSKDFFKELAKNRVHLANSPAEAIEAATFILKDQRQDQLQT
ncbi:MAG: TIGR00725 family protein [Candidatus Melainabacteria bacterium]|nr:TIGR00725 family protein [Candidatus Melainabacteria bacterium]